MKTIEELRAQVKGTSYGEVLDEILTRLELMEHVFTRERLRQAEEDRDNELARQRRDSEAEQNRINNEIRQDEELRRKERRARQ